MLFVSWTYLLSILFSLLGTNYGFFGWLNRRAPIESPPASASPRPATDIEVLPSAPFEMTIVDEKFLAEGKHLDLSPLDSCHYKVVNQLQSSCSDLSEEELAKLGVALFNCQAEAEGRKTYPCTSGMTLAECTAGMDADTWNAYHIVSNRARSVCYAARQMHFRRRTELTVNALVSTAVNQLEAMKLLKVGQEELKELTAESLQKVVSSQQELLLQQEQLQDSQAQMEFSITDNLQQLTQEKALIASGHQLMAQLIEGISEKMENVNNHLLNQDNQLQEEHQVILADLTEVQAKAQEIYSKMESNMALFLAYHNQTAQYYDTLMEKLQRMNQSLALVLYAMDHLQSSVELRLGHIQSFLGWAGMNLNAIYTCVLHSGYFLLLALLMTFLQTPGFSRALFLALVVMNALSELNHGVSLGFRSLTFLLICLVTGNWMLVMLLRNIIKMRNVKAIADPFPILSVPILVSSKEESYGKYYRSSTPERKFNMTSLKEELKKLDSSTSSLEDSNLENESLLNSDPFPVPPLAHAAWNGHRSLGRISSLQLRRITNSSRQQVSEMQIMSDIIPQRHLGLMSSVALSVCKTNSPNHSIASNMSVSLSSPRQLCLATTKAGYPCRNRAVTGQDFCHIHSTGQASYISSSGGTVGFAASALADNVQPAQTLVDP
ncbi:protein brambleberry [Microcaecilia unicolor]|uniref:Protein brambleberry-like n=1 Tax=Microcaecilia unicolor TaxID=1415580 RepID=A0A6P7WSD0_9AMPH|nr:protein brambleberry-like [Microcaecilia unicolor]XP_030046095.1 protein brambleberry-like [Microcaecilia unicolor]XP_030046096.1 protein brambleberry-like [Microcaecilia unicolor]XP_030046097.1 protein brambleberry-like [Microcaecilia unicolor]XP_030046098.1 protein brambleberry-like [Microcaecilia unicolor]XP_030046099.1 protein brambleberry-like [Microcaecilia unicolor]